MRGAGTTTTIAGVLTDHLPVVKEPRLCVSQSCENTRPTSQLYCNACRKRQWDNRKERVDFRAIAPEDAHRQTWIYFIGAADGTGPIKIGMAEDVGVRLDQLQTGSPVLLAIHGKVWCDSQWEGELHKNFADDRIHGEWFNRSPQLEEVVRLASKEDFAGMVNYLLRDYSG